MQQSHAEAELVAVVVAARQAVEHLLAEGLVEVVHPAVECLAAEDLTKTRAASESIRGRKVLVLVLVESPFQAEDQNGSEFEIRHHLRGQSIKIHEPLALVMGYA